MLALFNQKGSNDSLEKRAAASAPSQDLAALSGLLAYVPQQMLLFLRLYVAKEMFGNRDLLQPWLTYFSVCIIKCLCL